MNTKQRTVGVIMLLLAAGVVLFPPWRGELVEEGYKDPASGQVIIPSRYAEFRSPYVGPSFEKVIVRADLKTPRGSPIFSSPNSWGAFQKEGMSSTWHVNWKRIFVEWSVIVGASLLLTVLLRTRKGKHANQPSGGDVQ